MKLRRNKSIIDPIKYLIDCPGLWQKNEEQRAAMTTACRDTDYIKKVAEAGQITEKDGKQVQVMHNGIYVKHGGYHGQWMSNIIKQLKGHHEPQEEKIFNEVLKRVKPKSTIIELGSFWSYYSLWYMEAVSKARAICCEPDPLNIKIGKENAKLNNKEITFVQSAAGSADGKVISLQRDSNPQELVDVPIRSVDSLIDEYDIDSVELLHMDIQGVELDALKGAQKAIKNGKIRFVFVSTHHYFFSGNPNTHNECKSFLKDRGAHIISSHTVAESFSGDGLIVASFDKRDTDLVIDTSLNHTDDSLFRGPEDDVALLASLIKEGPKL